MSLTLTAGLGSSQPPGRRQTQVCIACRNPPKYAVRLRTVS